MSETARTFRLGLYVKNKDRRLSRNIAKKSVITNSKKLKQKKSADSFKDSYGNRNWIFREAHQRRLTEMEELRKFQSSTFDTLARRKLIEDQNTILELSGRVQELQNEVNCMNDSKDFQDAESVRSGNSHSASWKSLESFIQFTSFCSSCTLPDNSKIVFWSSMSFRLAIVSKVELWNFRNSSISVRIC